MVLFSVIPPLPLLKKKEKRKREREREEREREEREREEREGVILKNTKSLLEKCFVKGYGVIQCYSP